MHNLEKALVMMNFIVEAGSLVQLREQIRSFLAEGLVGTKVRAVTEAFWGPARGKQDICLHAKEVTD